MNPATGHFFDRVFRILWVTAAALSLFAFVPASEAAGEITVPRETVSGRLETAGGFGWRYGYDVEVRDGRVWVQVVINLIGVEGVSKVALERAKPVWEEGIERIWSDRFAIRAADGLCYPILVDVRFRGHRPHHDVVVRPGTGRTDELNWNITDSPTLVAHEFGHMLGCYDEYYGGALSPQTKQVDGTSIMTSNPTTGRTDPRHYDRFVAWFAGKTGQPDLALVPASGDLMVVDSGKE